MNRTPDPALLQAAARYSAEKGELSAELMPEMRRRSREARRALRGRHADEVEISTCDGLRLFSPRDRCDASRVIVYLHGGGWANCDTVTHGGIMTDLAALSGHLVAGPDYPLAPEHPYPAGLDAACAAVCRIAADHPHAALVLAGDSAGANLALATALRLHDEGAAPPLAALLLWYGCFRRCFDTRSHMTYGDGTYGLTTTDMRTYWDWYLADHRDPAYGDLTGAAVDGLPPCFLAEAEMDCLADDTRWLAGRLTQAGIPHAYDFTPAVNHGFIHFSQVYEPSYRSLQAAAHFLASPIVAPAAERRTAAR
ncbi:alpha/beta hydrolase fold domain-containing protein [Rhodobacteraceae bacterium 2CG4]|uniref:Alpha/beta hydrolase fold domain-containing protein n=1 Tax=Halovulum marinum TaxID=2662447 RepID=A0A6L5Z159_9RHOB|nr:alpha/beta hydrolase fold domain-containing protein [Halovulum marinum]MSU90049.1 alpha/beta hydrolase fold domain-containing protein [Halovulum marinum]